MGLAPVTTVVSSVRYVSGEFIFRKILSQHIAGHAMLSDINISQSNVATPLRCGGICNDTFIANFLLTVTVINFRKWSIFGEVKDKSLMSCFFDSRCRISQ